MLRPVFYGQQDIDTSTGAPGRLRIFYPSTEGSPQDAPFLEGGFKYPLVLFLHGHCTNAEHYKDWFVLPAQLARSAYVVTVPQLPATIGGTHPQIDPHPDLALITQVLNWVRTDWVHAGRVHSPARTAIIGHSFGALLGGRIATATSVAAYVSLSGVWVNWSEPPRRPIRDLTVPALFTWGSNSDDIVVEQAQAALEGSNAVLFNAVPEPKHRITFAGAHHWDYLPADRTTCERSTGPCDLVDSLAADLVTIFLSKYLPPAGSTISDDLTLPRVVLTPEQQRFTGGHLFGLQQIQNRPQDVPRPSHGSLAAGTEPELFLQPLPDLLLHALSAKNAASLRQVEAAGVASQTTPHVLELNEPGDNFKAIQIPLQSPNLIERTPVVGPGVMRVSV